MSLETVLAALVAITETIPAIGRVHNYDRRNIAPPHIRAEFGIDDPTIERGWSIRTYMWYRRGGEGRWLDIGKLVREDVHHLVLQSYWEVNDAHASERDWRITTDTLIALLANSATLFEIADAWTHPILTFEGGAMLPNLYVCHDMELHMDVTEIVNTSADSYGIILQPAGGQIWEG